MTNKINSIAILILLIIGIANAQDITDQAATITENSSTVQPRLSKKSQSATDNSWTGFYVGGYGGNSNIKSGVNTSAGYTTTGQFTPSDIPLINLAGTQQIKSNGFNGGGTFGYNYQKRRFLIGGEVDFGVNRINKSVSSNGAFTLPPFTFAIKQTVKTNWILTARPRVGIPFKKALVYATGGVAMTNIEYDALYTQTYDSGVEKGSFKKSKVGWTAGAGIEFKVAKRWSVKGEYLFSQFGRTSIISNDFTSNLYDISSTNPFTHSTDLKSHSIRFGVNYRF